MRSILSVKDQRLIHIIEILNRNEWISLNVLAEKLDCSEKTVRNDLKTLTTQYSHISIEVSNSLGYRLVHNDSSNENISDDIINDTLIFQIMFLLLKQSKLRLTDIESLLFATPNSIRSAIAQFNDFFKDSSNIMVESRPFQIVGDEIKITTIFLARLTQSYFKKDKMYRAEFQLINQLIDKLLSEHQDLKKLFLNDRFTLHLLFFVRIYREKNGHSPTEKNTYEKHSYSLENDKHFRDEFYSVFGTSLNNELLNKIVNFALYEPFSTSHLQMTYFFPGSIESKNLHPFVETILGNIAKKIQITPLNSAEINKIMLPKESILANKITNINYQQHDFLLQILHYELDEFVANGNLVAHKDLYELYLLVELALIILPGWEELNHWFNTIDLSMVAGLNIIANREYQLVYEHFFRYHSDQRIVFKDITTAQDAVEIDLLITNIEDYSESKIPVIHLSNLPTEEHTKKLEHIYFNYKLKKYLN